MFKLFRATQLPLLIGVVTLVGLAAAAALMPQSWRNGLRETGFDQVLALDRALRRSDDQQTKASIVVVDIDRRSRAAESRPRPPSRSDRWAATRSVAAWP